jgi:hypothetical protein
MKADVDELESVFPRRDARNRKRAIEQAIREEIEGYKAIYKKADKKKRDPTDKERKLIESHISAIETLKTQKDAIEATERVDGLLEALDELIAAAEHVRRLAKTL